MIKKKIMEVILPFQNKKDTLNTSSTPNTFEYSHIELQMYPTHVSLSHKKYFLSLTKLYTLLTIYFESQLWKNKNVKVALSDARLVSAHG